MKNKLILVLVSIAIIGCSGIKPTPTHDAAGIDPTITWTSVTARCTGSAVVVTYNVFVVTGSGPIPTVPNDPSEINSCGPGVRADLTKVVKDNASPITGTTYNAVRGAGTYTIAVEAVDPAGKRSYLSAQKTVTVVDDANAVTGVQVSWKKD